MSENNFDVLLSDIKTIEPTIVYKVPTIDSQGRLPENFIIGGTYYHPHEELNPDKGKHVLLVRNWDSELITSFQESLNEISAYRVGNGYEDMMRKFYKKADKYLERSLKVSKVMENQMEEHEDVHRLQEIRFGSFSLINRGNNLLIKTPFEKVKENSSLKNMTEVLFKVAILHEVQAYHGILISEKYANSLEGNYNAIISFSDCGALFCLSEKRKPVLDELLDELENGKYFDISQGYLPNTTLMAGLILLTDGYNIKGLINGEFDKVKVKKEIVENFELLTNNPSQFVKYMKEKNLVTVIDDTLREVVKEAKGLVGMCETQSVGDK